MKRCFSVIFSFPITLEWGGETVTETVYWFQYEDDPALNSNVYDVAAKLVQRHFPGEFGSERLVQKVVDIILRQTARREGENKGVSELQHAHVHACTAVLHILAISYFLAYEQVTTLDCIIIILN